MMRGAHDRAIGLVLSAIGRTDLDVRLVEAYIVVGGKSLRNLSPHQFRSLIFQAVQSIDMDPLSTRQQVRHAAGNPRKGDPAL